MSGTDNPAARQLRAFIERVERVEEEIKELNGDKSEIYKEIRGTGFDVKTVRKIVAKRKLDTDEREEQDALFDLYWSTLYDTGEETGTDVATRVQVHEPKGKAKATAGERLIRSAKQIQEKVRTGDLPFHDPVTGEIEDTSQSAEVVTPLAHAKPVPAESLGDKISAPITHLHRSSPDVDKADDANSSLVLSATLSPEPTPPALTIAGETAPQVSPAAHSDDDVPAFLKRVEPARKTVADYRTHCQNPSMCAASGLRHCNRCQKAMDAANPSEAAA